jgi:endonuclease III
VDAWEEIHDMDEDKLLEMVEDGGLGGKKVIAIREMLKLVYEKDDSYSLAFAEKLEDSDLKAFLMSVPEVGPKSALCVMMYAMKRAAFPVDAHVGRTLMRMGVFELVGLDLSKLDHKQKQRYLERLVPPDLRYSVHVLGLSLGRDICGARTPACGSCSLTELCKTGTAFSSLEVV